MKRRALAAAALLALAAMRAAAAPAPSDLAAALLRAGVAADLADHPARAFVFYELAARAGEAAGEFNTAVMDDSGIGTARDETAAALWYGRAAAHGFPRAAYDLGELAAAGDVLPANPALARRWFTLAGAPARARALRAGTPPATPPAPLLEEAQADPALPGGTVPVELVWREADMPEDTAFFVQIVRLDRNGLHQVAWTTTPLSALLLGIEARPGLYAWRVLAASAGAGHYAASGWATFRLAG